MSSTVNRMAARYLRNNSIVKGASGQEYNNLKAHINALSAGELTTILRKLLIGICMDAMDSAQFEVEGDDPTA